MSTFRKRLKKRQKKFEIPNIIISTDMDGQSRVAMFAALEKSFAENPESYIHGSILETEDHLELQKNEEPIQITYTYQGKMFTERVVLPYVVFKRPAKNNDNPTHFHYHVLREKELGSGGFATTFEDKFDIYRNQQNAIIIKEGSRKVFKIYSNPKDETATNELARLKQAYPAKQKPHQNHPPKKKVGLVTHKTGKEQRKILYAKRFKGIALHDALNDDKYNFSYPERLLIICNLIQALIRLHKRGVLHRDLKTENIILDPDTFKVKIIDMGLADPMDDIKMDFCGTYLILGPESRHLLTEQNSTCDLSKLDHFSLASIITEILQGNPFTYKQNVERLKDLYELPTSGDPYYFGETVFLKLMLLTAYDFNDIKNSNDIPDTDKWRIIKCLEQLSAPKPSKRPTLRQISINFNALLQPYLRESQQQLELLEAIEHAESKLNPYRGKGQHAQGIAEYHAELRNIKLKLAPYVLGDESKQGSNKEQLKVLQKASTIIKNRISSEEFTDATTYQAKFGVHRSYALFSFKAMLFKLKSWWPNLLGGSSKAELMAKHGWHNTNSLNCFLEYRKEIQTVEKCLDNTIKTMTAGCA